jgi:type II secretory ATPase GspE/PulE/Tfp pilus assembly ATPase PilB-like protein
MAGVTTDMQKIRDWLSPADRTLRLLTSDVMNSRGERDEFTCEWFQTHLVGFTRSSEDIFLVTGSGGSGKSFLSGWIAERLQRTLDKKTYIVNSVTIGM